MAARNPTGYTSNWPNELNLQPGEPLLASTLDSILDDQQFIRDCGNILVWSDRFQTIGVTSATPATVKTIHTTAKDILGTSGAGVVTCSVSVLLWGSTGATNVTVTVSSGSDSVSFAASTPGTTPTWQAFQSLDVDTNTQEDTLTIDISVPSGGGRGRVGGIIIKTDEL